MNQPGSTHRTLFDETFTRKNQQDFVFLKHNKDGLQNLQAINFLARGIAAYKPPILKPMVKGLNSGPTPSFKRFVNW